MSELYRVEHGDSVTIADTTFTCHIHVGSDTCQGCEPGVVQAATSSTQGASSAGKNLHMYLRWGCVYTMAKEIAQIRNTFLKKYLSKSDYLLYMPMY